ncbi:MmgE/PrpD family protein [Paraburkholderia sp. USG1]|uniref:MmgE/PrpD family protein n=1 Tax=Paraburkholderia sp. USG1 TaxID=2952268 RepID=UPI002854CAF5|nr:MmgE/PrpD family protein [Paraburkholderia sp. USG1]MDR8398705.1 MmgE/PrpD family protein [Paraburkholderia sp. USG1]
MDEMKLRTGLGLSPAIATFVSQVRYEDLPAPVIDKLKLCLFFNLGIATAGFRSCAGSLQALLPFALPQGHSGARVLVDGSLMSPADAAFINATMMHARTQDDFHHAAGSHVGAVAIPACLAIAQWRKTDPRRLMVALAVAYQVAAALGSGYAAGVASRGFRPSGVFASVGAAAACASLLGLENDAIANTLGLAANFACGLGQAWIAGTDEWRVHIAQASRNAVQFALLGEAGQTAAPDVFEGESGFFAAYLGSVPDVEAIIERLRGPWCLDAIGFKPLPVCGINLGPARSAAALSRAHRLQVSEITRVEISLPEAEAVFPGIAATGPIQGTGAALMRTAYVAAVCLLRGNLRFVDIEERTDPDILALAERITVTGEPGLGPMSHTIRIFTPQGMIEERYSPGSADFELDRESAAAALARIAEELAVPFGCIERLERAVWSADGVVQPDVLVDALIPDRTGV